MESLEQLFSAARDLFARGRRSEGVAAMSRAAEAGHDGALFELGLWSLIGDPLPRDLPRARDLLRRARLAGNVEAALMETALVANGTGGIADWPAARHLLEDLAQVAPIAQRQCALLAAMDLAANGTPLSNPAGEPLDSASIVMRFPGLLSATECAHLAAAGGEVLEPALVVDPATGRQSPHPIRTSDAGVIGPTRENLVVRAINHRIAAISGTDVAQGEALTILRYQPGQEYRMHLDILPGTANQRAATVLIYLNAGFEGGATWFPELNLTIAPQQGDAIVYRNTTADGRPDPRTRHAGLPVTNGVKWLATRWIRARPFDVWTGPESAP